jgi:hypothetical protein
MLTLPEPDEQGGALERRHDRRRFVALIKVIIIAFKSHSHRRRIVQFHVAVTEEEIGGF